MDFNSRVFWTVGIVLAMTFPALLTNGRCSAFLDDELAQLKRDAPSFASPKLADAYWSKRAVEHVVLSPEECRLRQPRNLDECGEGTLVMATVPVDNWICRTYRDDDIQVWHMYDRHQRLVRFDTDMEPCKEIPIPFTKYSIAWAG